MAAEYSRNVARVAAGQLVEQAGFDAVHESAIEVLAGLLLRYVGETAAGANAYAELACRAEANVADVALALEDLGTTMEDLLQYQKGLAEASPDQIPPTFAQPLAPYPVRRTLPATPTFADKGEVPPAHIPAFLPAFPDPHTYIHTPKFVGHETDPVQQNKVIQAGRRTAERALLQLHQRITRTKAEHAASGSGRGGGGAAAPENPFLATPAFEMQPDPLADRAGAAGFGGGTRAGGTGRGDAEAAAAGMLDDAPGTRAFEALLGTSGAEGVAGDVGGGGAAERDAPGAASAWGGWLQGGGDDAQQISWKTSAGGTDSSGTALQPLGFSGDWASVTRARAQAFAIRRPEQDAFKDGGDAAAAGGGGGGGGAGGSGWQGGARGGRKRKSIYGATPPEASRRRAEEILNAGPASLFNVDGDAE